MMMAEPNLQTRDNSALLRLQQTHRCLLSRLYISTKPKEKKSSVKMFFRRSHILWILIICEAVSGNSSDFWTNAYAKCCDGNDIRKSYYGTELLFCIYKIILKAWEELVIIKLVIVIKSAPWCHYDTCPKGCFFVLFSISHQRIEYLNWYKNILNFSEN